MKKYKNIITYSVWDYVKANIEAASGGTGVNVDEFQKRVGFDDETMYQLITGDLKLLPAQAAKLENLFGISFQTWLNLDRMYHENVEKIDRLMEENDENPARKAVLLAIHPRFSNLILDGVKTIEVRRSRPNLELPFKVYMYETLRGGGCGMIVGEWICEMINHLVCCDKGPHDYDHKKDVDIETRLSKDEFLAYTHGDLVYGWRASVAKRYDEPLPLSVFDLRRPPQSWGYVEEIGGGH